ncbi:universal stress protein [Streptacidiphilus sp. EB129]|uniref:universal stress protein n=1 Tax=Streptacidiphilus sp. EB129 TaxID=3156262 RepID=UPI0035181D7A
MPLPVIVGAADAPSAVAAVDWAADEAALRGTRLHLVHAWQWEPGETPTPTTATPTTAASTPVAAEVEQGGERLLDELVRRARSRQAELEISSETADSSARDALNGLSGQAQVLVVGARGRGGFPALLIGSTSLYLAARAACPVVVVPDGGGEPVGGVTVGLHGQEPNDEVLSFAFETCLRRRLPLRAVHTWSYPLIRLSGRLAPPVYERGHVEAEQARLVAELLAGWREKYPQVPVEEDIVRAGPAKHLVTLSEHQQLLVVGRHGTPEGPVGRLGSVSQAVVQHARCPVAVIPVG